MHPFYWLCALLSYQAEYIDFEHKSSRVFLGVQGDQSHGMIYLYPLLCFFDSSRRRRLSGRSRSQAQGQKAGTILSSGSLVICQAHLGLSSDSHPLFNWYLCTCCRSVTCQNFCFLLPIKCLFPKYHKPQEVRGMFPVSINLMLGHECSLNTSRLNCPWRSCGPVPGSRGSGGGGFPSYFVTRALFMKAKPSIKSKAQVLRLPSVALGVGGTAL